MKHLLVLVYFLWMPFFLFSQQDSVDVLHIENGNIIRGEIIQETAEKLRLRTLCNSMLVFQKDEIALRHRELSKCDPEFPGGYFYSLDLGFVLSTGMYAENGATSVQLTNGYRFNFGLSAGAIAGVEYFGDPLIPVLGDLRYHFSEKDVSKYVYFRGGRMFYARSLESESEPVRPYIRQDRQYQSGYLISPV